MKKVLLISFLVLTITGRHCSNVTAATIHAQETSCHISQPLEQISAYEREQFLKYAEKRQA
jgi:hypothetical protein